MSKKLLSGLSLRSGALAFSLFTALGACATVTTPPHTAAPAVSIKPSQAAWGYPIGASSETEVRSAAPVSQPAPAAICDHEPAAPRTATQTSC